MLQIDVIKFEAQDIITASATEPVETIETEPAETIETKPLEFDSDPSVNGPLEDLPS